MRRPDHFDVGKTAQVHSRVSTELGMDNIRILMPVINADPHLKAYFLVIEQFEWESMRILPS
jgi:hypothetical protein